MDGQGSDEPRRARPHTRLTADGRRVREVVTYSRRSSRLSDRQAAVWERRHREWWVPDEALDRDDLDLRSWFGREAPLVVEIGSGIGEATVALAAARPSYDVLAFEVWRPGVADTFFRMEQAGISNVRLTSVDAVWSMGRVLAPESIQELWTFFPDPWPKQRHQGRRLVSAPFAHLAAGRLVPGGLWRLATDWPAYAEQMAEVLDAEPMLQNVYDGPAPRWEERPLTRFERRGIEAGRPITDLAYRRG